MRVAFIVGFGLLPLWAALAFIAYAFATMRSDQAGMAFWALLPAIPACGVTVLIAGLGSAIYTRTAGDSGRKWTFSAGFVSLACLALAMGGVWYVLVKQKNEQILLHEQGLVVRFVQENDEVRREVGGSPTVSIASYSLLSSGPLPVWYDISVKGTKTVYAIVEVDRSTKPTTFHLRCTTPLYMGSRQPFKGPCEQ